MAVEYVIRPGSFLEYSLEGSTGPGRTAKSTIRFIFKMNKPGQFNVIIEADEISKGLYANSYGDQILVDGNLFTPKGIPLQFNGLCPLLLSPSQISERKASWLWDGAGVQDMSGEKMEISALLKGPLQWKSWNTYKLARYLTEGVEAPPGIDPLAYYEETRGLLVGVEWAADMGAMGKFIYCNAALISSNVI